MGYLWENTTVITSTYNVTNKVVLIEESESVTDPWYCGISSEDILMISPKTDIIVRQNIFLTFENPTAAKLASKQLN